MIAFVFYGFMATPELIGAFIGAFIIKRIYFLIYHIHQFCRCDTQITIFGIRQLLALIYMLINFSDQKLYCQKHIVFSGNLFSSRIFNKAMIAVFIGKWL